MEECKMLKALRKFHGIKAQKLADELNINLNTYCKKENGKTQFTLSECRTISNVIGKTVDEIFFGNNIAQ